MELSYFEISLGVIGFLLSSTAADFYRRLYLLKGRVKGLEEKMTSFELAQALASRDISGVAAGVAESKALAETKILPTLQELATNVAVLNDRLKRHMNGGNNEGS